MTKPQTNKLTRRSLRLTKVEVKHDPCPEDPRQGQDLVCEIEDGGYSWQHGHREIMKNLIERTKGYEAAVVMADAADIDPPDLDEKDNLEQWVEMIKSEVIIKSFWTGNHDARYVAHTTPKLCEKLGVRWEDAERCMDSEIELFTQWCEGDTWGVVVSEADEPEDEDDEPDWVEKDSCWGFYSLDEQNGMMDHVPEPLRPQLREALRNPTY